MVSDNLLAPDIFGPAHLDRLRVATHHRSMDPKWQRLVDTFLSEEIAEFLPRDDGGFEVSLQCGSMEIATLLAHIPCKLERRATGHEPMVDNSGEEVDVEYTWGHSVNEEELVLFHYHEHYASGVHATLTKFGSRAAFDTAVAGQRVDPDD